MRQFLRQSLGPRARRTAQAWRLSGDKGRVRIATASALTLLVLTVTGCSGNRGGSVSIEEAAKLYSEGTEEMRIKGALVIEYGQPMLCSGVVRDQDPGTPICKSPAYWIAFGGGLPDVKLEGDGRGQWAEDVSFIGTLDEGVFTID
jgi:hypothetical protein